MGFLVGPDSGELAEDDATFARIDGTQFDSPIPALFIDDSQFPNPEEFGLRTGQQNPSGEWVVLETLAVDVSSRYEVDVYDVRTLADPQSWDADKAIRIAGTVFPDPHPDKWWRDVHDETGRLFLFVGPLKQHFQPGNRVDLEFLRHAHAGIVPLVIRAYGAGVGTRPPAEEKVEEDTDYPINEPTRHRSDAERRALGLDRRELNEEWRRFSTEELYELANDVRVAAETADFDDIRLPWLSAALEENSRMIKMSDIVGDFIYSLRSGVPLAPGAIYSVRFRAFHDSVNFAASRHFSENPSRERLDLELKSMFSARLWMKSPAYFLPREHIETTTPADSPLTSLTLPNVRCLVFHDRPLPIDIPIGGAQRSVLAWVFVSGEHGTLEGAQILTVADDNSDGMVANGSIESPALREWASRVLPALSSGHWSPAPRLKLPGKPMDRTWRRALERKRDREAATGSLDGVRLLTPSTGADQQ